MPESKRQKIINLVVARMQTILTDNDFETDLGETVEDWRVNWDDSELPALSVCDTTAEETLPGDQPTASRQINQLTVLLKIFCKSDTRASDLRTMIADVKNAVKTDVFWNDGTNNLAIWTKPGRSGITVSNESFEIAGAEVEIEIGYFTNIFES